MKIFNAVYTAAVFLQLDALCDALSERESGGDSEMPESERKEAEILVRCCNLVLHELSESYFPLIERVKAKAADGRIYYDSLPKKITDVVSVKKNGVKVFFREFFDCITVPEDGEYALEYAFEPPAVTLNDDSPFKSAKPSARLAAYGIAREYCLISGMTDDAAMWDGRFLSCAQEQSRNKREKRVKRRAWL